jgi:hypothetical protein
MDVLWKNLNFIAAQTAAAISISISFVSEREKKIYIDSREILFSQFYAAERENKKRARFRMPS